MRENIKHRIDKDVLLILLSIGEPLDREKRVIVQSIYAFAFL